MTYKISSKGFINETLTINVIPTSWDASTVLITVHSDAFEIDDDNHDLYNLPGSFARNQNFQNDGVWDSPCGRWEETPTVAQKLWTVVANEVEDSLKVFTQDFYDFHKQQNETANLTIKTIRNLRVEDIVGEHGWEVVKTTTRSGSRRG